MAAPSVLFESDLKSLPFLHRGKVRDIYAVGDDKLLVVQTDRLSAFDVILDDPIPGKGQVLTALSLFWFGKLAHVIPNHLTGIDPATVVADAREREQIAGRAMVVRRFKPLLVEAVVRGYVAGSGWKDYQDTGAICGIRLAPGLRQAEKLPQPIFTPASKAPAGQHDENIPFARVETLISPDLAHRVRAASLALYLRGAAVCERAGIILADTKFEFGVLPSGELLLIDEALTPDSSRFWEAAAWAPGGPQPSYDKQYVRDWLERQPWDKSAPGPDLPADVVAGTRERYVAAFERITGGSFARYLEEDVIAP